MTDAHEQAGATATTQAQASEEEMRAAYEAELNRISSSEMILQTAVSLLNIGGRRLGLAPPASASDPSHPSAAADSERDLEQVRDAIDGASALMPILERRMPGELGPLRDAIAQLQVAYAREAQSSASTTQAAAQPPPEAAKSEQSEGPGPAQASGRLWVPGR